MFAIIQSRTFYLFAYCETEILPVVLYGKLVSDIEEGNALKMLYSRLLEYLN
jgi:hypothetical protein